eukprot:scaffold13947_cov38-Attheya_sp.AAC.2
MVRPKFEYSDGMPRHTNNLVSFNELPHRTKKGHQPRNPPKRDKTEVLFLESSSHEDQFTKIGNLAGQLKDISMNPDSVELMCLLDNNLTDIRDQIKITLARIVARSWARARLNFAPALVGHIVARTWALSWALLAFYPAP